MGKWLPETCWADSKINNIVIVASSWSFILFTYIDDALSNTNQINSNPCISSLVHCQDHNFMGILLSIYQDGCNFRKIIFVTVTSWMGSQLWDVYLCFLWKLMNLKSYIFTVFLCHLYKNSYNTVSTIWDDLCISGIVNVALKPF